MIGKIFFNNEWVLCKYEDHVLYILKQKCSKPIYIKHAIANVSAEISIASFETGDIYYFDLNSAPNIELSSDFYERKYEKPNYFIVKDEGIKSNFSVPTLNKISFVGGVISVMMEHANLSEISAKIGNIDCKIVFNHSKEKYDEYCRVDTTKYILAEPIERYRYSIDVTFESISSINKLNGIIDTVYNFIRLTSLDFTPYLEKIEVQINGHILQYYKNDINNIVSDIKYGNYYSNYKSCMGDIFSFVNKNNPNLGFLKLLSIYNYNKKDYFTLAQSVENIVVDNDVKAVQSLKEEVGYYQELRKAIKTTIDQYEKEKNHKMDSAKKGFILRSIDMATFRQKVACLLETYNDFAKGNKKYEKLCKEQIETISKDLQTARNQIHGKNAVMDDSFFNSIQYILMGLCIYIFKKCNFSDAAIFIVLESVFSHTYKLIITQY